MSGVVYIKKIICLIIASVVAVIIFTSCNYRLYTDSTGEKLQKNVIRSIILCSYDPFGPITRAIITELNTNRIDVFGDLNDLNDNVCIQEAQIPRLNIINASEKRITTSVFQNGKEAEYRLTLHIETNLFIPNSNYYPINVNAYRSLIRNPEKVLFNDMQEHDMRKEIYRDAAQQLIYQLFLRFEDFYN
ncbi:LPS assembly lipoprotein LptE [Blochmannia endosymbiont of Camponotus sp. C-003]|uniref:LPS assembly lipoprotein LptE n=1 Tax=unclassified Candidatus Blochmanniella TaxID=711328 RepID=UPI002023D995|nr:MULTISPECIES: LPS assembly lipoprotein LptE [unclassified Candidatus Blochmannia]URJ23498.1 LPS assembly lipoprotein LptE [Blochmannia endosymbiont of Camponotus sp. C-003]URJ28970.1 LPS assembly lipoprotein LptE [Blochmannia endosymbiont of Camponotus sp. C-046]